MTFGAWNGRIGKVHLGVVIYVGGSSSPAHALVVDRWLYRRTDLYAAYDTEQEFSSRYDCGSFSYLSPWHVKGRYLMPQRSWWRRLVDLVNGVRDRSRFDKPPRLQPLLAYEPELRWFMARELVRRGRL